VSSGGARNGGMWWVPRASGLGAGLAAREGIVREGCVREGALCVRSAVREERFA